MRPSGARVSTPTAKRPVSRAPAVNVSLGESAHGYVDVLVRRAQEAGGEPGARYLERVVLRRLAAVGQRHDEADAVVDAADDGGGRRCRGGRDESDAGDVVVLGVVRHLLGVDQLVCAVATDLDLHAGVVEVDPASRLVAIAVALGLDVDGGLALP